MDRVLANDGWLEIFPTAKVYNMEGSPSDHSPLYLIPEIPMSGKRRRKFRFENNWLTEAMCFQIVKSCWDDEENGNVMQRVQRCAESLDIWGREITGCFSRRIKECKNRLRVLRDKRDDQSLVEYEEARKQLFLVLDQKEIFWRQRSKQLWLQAEEKTLNIFMILVIEESETTIFKNSGMQQVSGWIGVMGWRI